MNNDIPNTSANTPAILVPRGFVKAAPKYTAANDFVLISREVVRKSEGGMHLPDAAPIVRNEGKIISVGPLVKGEFKEGQVITFTSMSEHLLDLRETECICAVRENLISAIKE